MTQQLALLDRPHAAAPGPTHDMAGRSRLSADMPCQDTAEKDPVLSCLECNRPLVFQRRSKQFCNNTCCQRYGRRERRRPPGLPDMPALHYGRFEDYQDRYAGMLDVIITDPPYAREALPIYAALAQFALATLVPGGHLFCLNGGGTNYEIETSFREAGLEFLYVITYEVAGAATRAEKQTSTGLRAWYRQTKPLLWYQKPGTRRDHRRVGGADRIGHTIRAKNTQNRAEFHWQQDLPAFQHLLAVYTNRGDIICDPCCGSGTTLVAALTRGRHRVIGIDCDREAYSQAVERVQDMQRAAAGQKAGLRHA